MQTLEVKNLTKSYYGKKALDNVSFTVKQGQIVGLLGPNGAGKTTTMSIITGILAANKGEVLFDGQKMTSDNEHQIKQKIGFLSEANPLYGEMLVYEYLDFMAGLRGIELSERKKAIKHVAGETGIKDKLFQPIEELSKGYKQRVGLAQAILHQPEILILDEPTEGLDPNQRVTIRSLIKKLGADRTVMISTHVLSEVQSTCQSVLILNEGRLISSGTVQEVIQQGQKGQKIKLQAKGDNIADVLFSQNGMEIIEKNRIDGLDDFTLICKSGTDFRPQIYNLAKQNGWILYELHEQASSLEDIFRTLTSGGFTPSMSDQNNAGMSEQASPVVDEPLVTKENVSQKTNNDHTQQINR